MKKTNLNILKAYKLKLFVCKLALFLTAETGYSQDLYNNILFTVKGSGSLYISNSFTNESSASYLNDGMVTIKGNISNKQASMNQGIGTTNITGAAVQNLSGTQAFVVYNVNINNTSAGNSNFVFSNDLIVGNTANFIDGIVVTNSNKMSFKDNTSYTGASNSTHVNGWVKKTGNQSFTFPVGDGAYLRTAGIGAPTLTSDVFICKYFYSNPDALYNVLLKDATLSKISTCEYWMLNRTSGSSAVPVTLTWLSPNSDCIPTIPNDLKVSRWDGSTWKDHGNGSYTGTATSGSVVTASTPTSFSPFTLAIPIGTLSMQVTNLNVKNTEEGNTLFWQTPLRKIADDIFWIEKSCDGITWNKLQYEISQYSSLNNIDFSTIDSEPCNGHNYYKLIEKENNSTNVYPIISIENKSDQQFTINVYPNPGTGLFIADVGEEKFTELEILDIYGKVLKKQFLLPGKNQIDCSLFSSGDYFVKFNSDYRSEIKKITVEAGNR